MKGIHKSLLGRLRSWTHYHHAKTAIIVAGGLVLASGITVFALLYRPPQKTPTAPVAVSTKTPAPIPKPVIYYSPLTGEKVPDQASTQQAVTGVMIENSPGCRYRQSGLKQAGVVYEAIAEGGITRFLALYQQQSRSSSALFAVCASTTSIGWHHFKHQLPNGGSAEALKEIRNGSYRDLDQFFNAPTYWRTVDRYAPQCLHRPLRILDALNTKKGYATSTFTAWQFRQDAAPAKTPNASTINVTISSALYNSQYKYDAASNSYARFQAGAPHLDREQGQIIPSVVIVMEVTESTVMQDGYREQITTTGSKAHVFQNGTEIEATWSKADRGSQTKFSDASGKEVFGLTRTTDLDRRRAG